MESSNEIRRIQKRYKCEKCGKVYSKLAETYEEYSQCETCDWMGEEISEEQYKAHKGKLKREQVPDNHNASDRPNDYYQINMQNNDNISAFSLNGGNPFSSLFNDSMFGSFFSSPFAGRVRGFNINNNIFMPEFHVFGSSDNDTFRDNFFSNFRSSYVSNDILSELINQIRTQQEEGSEHPTSKEALNRLKDFKMDESRCKKAEGKLELPNCIVCVSDIEIGASTLMLPCAHMFHSQCVKIWLEKHNTCPVCRFELPKQY